MAGVGHMSAAEVAGVSQAPEDPLILSVSQASNGFAADLFAQLRRQPGNISFAPLSLSQSLLPILAGTQGQTGEELAKVLRLTVPVKEAADGYATLFRRLQRAAGGSARLDFAKALWVQQWNSVNPDYVELLRQHCRSELRVIDFARGEHAAHWINRWVSDATDDRIPAIAEAKSFEPETCLLVGNAVFFRVDWKDDFDPAQTAPAPFHIPAEPVAVSAPAPAANPAVVAPPPAPASQPAASNPPAPATPAPAPTATNAATSPAMGASARPVSEATESVAQSATPAPAPVTIDVPTMRRVAPLRMVAQPGCRLLQLPYRGDQFSLVVLLPEANTPLAKIEEHLTSESLAEYLRAVRAADLARVEVRLPKFKSERPVLQLGAALKALGAKTVFDRSGAADFASFGSNLDGAPIYLSSINQLVKLSVDERGAEAGAATAPGSEVPYDVPVEAPAPFHVDRPFLFFICDNQTGSVLFMGRIVDPRAG